MPLLSAAVAFTFTMPEAVRSFLAVSLPALVMVANSALKNLSHELEENTNEAKRFEELIKAFSYCDFVREGDLSSASMLREFYGL